MEEQARRLAALRDELDAEDDRRLAPLAARHGQSVRRRPDLRPGHRQAYAQDADRILHSKAYSRYIDKTQVFSLIDNDHITHRVLHVQLVARIARTVGRFLRLNEDLIEAIALGHDIGHPPFGHEGERILGELCRQHGLPSFQHNLQGVQFLEQFERKGRGWNLTLQTLDGILCHDGESHLPRLAPCRSKDFSAFDDEIRRKEEEPLLPLRPLTLEGCVVRLADTIGYIGRDIEDAIELGLITRAELPPACTRLLGDSNGAMVYTLVSDLIDHNRHLRKADAPGGTDDWLGFSPTISTGLLELKKFNYERIYHNPAFKPDFARIRVCYQAVFAHCLARLEDGMRRGQPGARMLDNMAVDYYNRHPPAAQARDYVAGMTDAFFLRQAKELGCQAPERRCLPR